MATLDDLRPGVHIKGLFPGKLILLIEVKRYGASVAEVTYKDASGNTGSMLLYQDDAARLEIASDELRFIEVKGRVQGAATVTVTKNEVLTALNKPDDFILAVILVDENDATTTHYIQRPFTREPDFGATSINYDLAQLLRKSFVSA